MAHRIAFRTAGALLVALPVVAAAAGDDARPGFGKADANGDGKISVEEAKSAGVPAAEAKREDIDNDGQLTKADWKFVDMDAEASGSGES
jgi:hypothetical protein